MHNKIYKVDSTKTPAQSRAFNGPATSGIEYDLGRNALVLNPDGTRRSYPATWAQDFVANGAAAQTANNFDVFWTAPYGVTIVGVVERHSVAGSDGGAVTLDVRKVPSGTAVAAGTTLLTGTINLKAAANTNQVATLTATAANLALAKGDSIGVLSAGVLTALVNVSVTVEMKRTPDVA